MALALLVGAIGMVARLGGALDDDPPGEGADLAFGTWHMAWQRLSSAFDQAQSIFREPQGGVVVQAAGRTDVGSVRRQNEDCFVVTDLTTGRYAFEPQVARFSVGDRGVLLAVSDGMGGAAAGEVASALVLESLQQHLETFAGAEDQVRSLEYAVECANRDVWNAAQTVGRRGMGATLVAVLVHRSNALVASVGDSRAYLIRHGEIHQITKDHSYVQMLVDAAALSAEEALLSPYRNIILQAMGTRPDVTVALGRLDLRRGDRILLCSDGLSEKVQDLEMLDLVQKSLRLDVACTRLVELANMRGGDDNITVIAAEANGEELPKPVRGERTTAALEIIQEFTPK